MEKATGSLRNTCPRVRDKNNVTQPDQRTAVLAAKPRFFCLPCIRSNDEEGWVVTQLNTTLDVDCYRWMDWFHGGLQFQVPFRFLCCFFFRWLCRSCTHSSAQVCHTAISHNFTAFLRRRRVPSSTLVQLSTISPMAAFKSFRALVGWATSTFVLVSACRRWLIYAPARTRKPREPFGDSVGQCGCSSLPGRTVHCTRSFLCCTLPTSSYSFFSPSGIYRRHACDTKRF